MLEKNINSTHIWYMSNISDNGLKELEKVLTENFGNNNAICYTINKGYGFNTGSVQIEAMYEDNVIFMGACKTVIEALMNVKPLWKRDDDDLF